MTIHTGGDFIVLPRWENQVTGTMTQYQTQSHYSVEERTSLFPILEKLNSFGSFIVIQLKIRSLDFNLYSLHEY